MKDYYCTPNVINKECNFMGKCNSNGTSCECFDSHRRSEDRCLFWNSEIKIINGSQKCQPGDRNKCHNRGKCSNFIDLCICDDKLHYWSVDDCLTYHEEKFCVPNSVDEYCNWQGRCNQNGTICNCFDNDHRISEDRCLNWYQSVDDELRQLKDEIKHNILNLESKLVAAEDTKLTPTFKPTTADLSIPTPSPTSSPTSISSNYLSNLLNSQSDEFCPLDE